MIAQVRIKNIEYAAPKLVGGLISMSEFLGYPELRMNRTPISRVHVCGPYDQGGRDFPLYNNIPDFARAMGYLRNELDKYASDPLLSKRAFIAGWDDVRGQWVYPDFIELYG